jgi:N-methylhydantoinase B/oxoprolinase/acetone carboxylase alpha subunit
MWYLRRSGRLRLVRGAAIIVRFPSSPAELPLSLSYLFSSVSSASSRITASRVLTTRRLAVTFGSGGKDVNGEAVQGYGYYETICGGSGAGPTWEGTSSIHTHMTNTRVRGPFPFCLLAPYLPHALCRKNWADGLRADATQITDPEVLERRYPTILHQFSIRKGSGGKGQHNGGNGVIRVRYILPVGCIHCWKRFS